MIEDKWLAQAPDVNAGRKLSLNLPQLLRLTGGGMLLFALYNFLVNGWDDMSDLGRYGILLIHIGTMVLIALTTGHYLKESKGPRLLISLALAAVPVAFTILGAFLYDPDIEPRVYPEFMQWSLGDMVSSGLITGVSLLLLLPVIKIGFTSLARPVGERLSLIFVLSNMMLLLPVRSIEISMFMVIFMSLALIWISRSISRAELSARTVDGLVALTLQFIPVLILLGRCFWLEDMTAWFNVLTSLVLFVLLRQVGGYMHERILLNKWLAYLSLLLVLMMFPALISATKGVLWAELRLPVTALLASLMLMDLSARTTNRIYMQTGGVLMMLFALLNMLDYQNAISGWASVAMAVLMMLQAVRYKTRMIFHFAVFVAVTGLLVGIGSLLKDFDFGSWAGLTLLGVMTIVSGSVIDSQRVRFKSWFERYKAVFN